MKHFINKYDSRYNNVYNKFFNISFTNISINNFRNIVLFTPFYSIIIFILFIHNIQILYCCSLIRCIITSKK